MREQHRQNLGGYDMTSFNDIRTESAAEPENNSPFVQYMSRRLWM